MGRFREFMTGEMPDIQSLDGSLVVDATDLGEPDGPAALPLTEAERPGFVKLVSDIVAEQSVDYD